MDRGRNSSAANVKQPATVGPLLTRSNIHSRTGLQTSEPQLSSQKSGILAVGTMASFPVEKNPNLFSAQTFSIQGPERAP